MKNILSIDDSMHGVDLEAIDAALPFESALIHIDNVTVTKVRYSWHVEVMLLLEHSRLKIYAPFGVSVYVNMLDKGEYDDRMIAYTQLIIKAIKYSMPDLKWHLRKEGV